MLDGISKIKYIHNLLVSGEMTSREITEKYLNNINNSNDKINAYILTTSDIALNTAMSVDKKIKLGQKLFPLEGIPMILKDNISTDGIKTTCCSKMLQNYVPIYDATVWSILKNQNAILLGKGNMDEFAMGSSGETSCFGATLNPCNSKYVAGGSSSGVAAAVASSMAVYGIGSDTGGSVRQPASFCGVVGLKPTYGTISRYGLIAYASSFDQIGIIASNVEDVSIIYDFAAKHDCMDSTSVSNDRVSETSDYLQSNIKGMKIGIVKEFFANVNDDVVTAINDSMKIYEKLGAEIKNYSMPVLKYTIPAYYILASAEAASNLGRYDGIRYGCKVEDYDDLNEMICKTRSQGFGREVKKRILLGTYVLSSGYYDAYYKKAQQLRKCICSAFEEIFRDCDVLITPTVPQTAFEANESQRTGTEIYSSDICTAPANIAGLPAVSVPCGFDRNRLPIGMQIIGNKFKDRQILAAAYKYETETEAMYCMNSKPEAEL